jgi:hypothetical protein
MDTEPVVRRTASFGQVMAGLNAAYQNLNDLPVEPLRAEDPFRMLIDLDDDFVTLEISKVFGIHYLRLDLTPLFVDALRQGNAAVAERCESLTVGEVAEYLRSVVPPTSLDPIEIACTRCGKAAAFLALRELVPPWKRKRIAPSRCLEHCLSVREISELCERLKWVAPDRSLARSEWSSARWQNVESLRTSSWLTLVIGCVIASGGIPEIGVFFVVFTLLLRGIARMIADNLSPLPDGVKTFRDLANAIAHSQ